MLFIFAACFGYNSSVSAKDFNVNVCRNESANGDIQAITEACSRCETKIRNGEVAKTSAFWFSTGNYKTNELKISSDTRDSMVYLYGAHYSCMSNGEAVSAKNIAFCSEANVDCGHNESKRFKYLEPILETLDMGITRNQYLWSNVGSPIATTLHVQNMINDGVARKTGDNKYEADVYIWQCQYGGKACWSEKQTLNITIEGMTSDAEKLCSEWTPTTPTSEVAGTSSVAAAVRNLNTETGWVRNTSKIVFAKPFDAIEFLHCYFSGAQSTSETNVTTDEKDNHPLDILNDKKVQVPNNKLPYRTISTEISDWSNALTVTSAGIGEGHAFVRKFKNGNVATVAQSDTYSIETGHDSKAGARITETNVSGYPSSVKIYEGERHLWECNWHDEEHKINEKAEVKEKYAPEDVLPTSYVAENFFDVCGCSKSTSGKINCKSPCTINVPMDCSHEAPGYVQYDIADAVSETATVVVPYNYSNNGDVWMRNDKIFSGETATISAKALTNPKYNKLTDGTYATVVRNAKIRLFIYATDNGDQKEIRGIKNDDLCATIDHLGGNYCHEVKTVSEDRILNTPENVNGAVYDMATQTVNVYDVDAGNYFCAAVAVWPSTSGADDNTNINGDESWMISKPNCKPVYKKPFFRVLGGMYVEGEISGNIALKNNIRNFDDYEYKMFGGKKLAFGSWASQEIVTNSGVKNVGSGASYGMATSNDPGGTTNRLFCQNTPLTFPNSGCSIFGINGGIGHIIGDAILEKTYATFYGGHEFKRTNGAISLNNEDNYYQNNSMRYTEANKGAAIQDSTLDAGITHLIYSYEDMKIEGNLIAEGEFSDNTEIPLYIIYAEGNVEISCSVDRIDAWILSKGYINTCYDGGDDNSGARSNALRINGITYSKGMNLGRTFGGDSGLNSSVPAETFNFTPSSYLFVEAKQSQKTEYNTVYIKEKSVQN